MNQVIYVSGDWHLQPHCIPERCRTFLGMAAVEKAKVILLGDIFDFIPLGWKKYVENPYAFTELGHLLRGLDYEIIPGNHDPLEYWWNVWGQMIPKPIDLVRFHHPESYQLGPWYFTHGHQRSDWALHRFIAPWLTEWMVDRYPELWYHIMKRMGWLPSEQKGKALKGEQEHYSLLTLAIHNAWRRWGEQQGLSVGIGHTHKAEVSYTLNSQGGRDYLVNSGDMKLDSTYVVIRDGEAEVREA